MQPKYSIHDLDTPVLLVDLDRLERNIQQMATTAATGGKSLWPHTKTHKSIEIARMQMDAGGLGLTVAKLAEAKVLADAGFTNIFVANNIVGAQKIDQLLDLAERVSIRVGVDSIECAKPIGAMASARKMRAGVMIEVDSGQKRSGVRSVEEGAALARAVSDCAGLELLGAFTHEGHLYKIADPVARNAAARDVARQMRALGDAAADQGTPFQVLSVGSTPGAQVLAIEPGVTEIRPGVYVFGDRMQSTLGFDIGAVALTVLATVISVRPDGRVIVDAGVKALASDSPFPDKTYGLVLDHPEFEFVAASEEHGHLQAVERSALRVGDKIRIMPNHACTCVNMHDTMTLHREDRVEAIWRVASRGQML